MASASVRKRVSQRTGRVSYDVWWRLDDGSQGMKTFAKKSDAAEYKNAVLAKERALRDQANRARATQRFDQWADAWWAVWSTHPRRSPNSLQGTESRLRLHVRPWFGHQPLRAISVRSIQQWQNQLEAKLSHESVMACRSILYSILQAAEDDEIIRNPVRKVSAPKRPVDPDIVFGEAKPRVLTPEQAGYLLAGFPAFWWDHIISLLGTGLRFGEFAGLRAHRVHLDRPIPVLQVVDTRYQAGKFGSGFKDRPKSAAGFREIPLPRQVTEAIRRRLPPGSAADELVFTGPGGANGVPRGVRTVLSRDNFRRTFHAAVAKLADHAADLPPSCKRVLKALRAGGPQTVEQLAARLAGHGRKLAPRTVQAALHRLQAEGLTLPDREQAPRWSPSAPSQPGALDDLELHGPHDLRHTYATWLEDAGIPDRVIDELMGHQSRRAGHELVAAAMEGAVVGRRYRHTTDEMRARVVAAIEVRLIVTLGIARKLLDGDRTPAAMERHEQVF
jgi:integrase